MDVSQLNILQRLLQDNVATLGAIPVGSPAVPVDNQPWDINAAGWCNQASIASLQTGSWFQKRVLFQMVGITRGTAIMAALEAIATGTTALAPVAAQIFGLLDQVQTGGLDMGVAESQTFVTTFVNLGIITADEGQLIQALGQIQVSPATNVGLPIVMYWDVGQARNT